MRPDGDPGAPPPFPGTGTPGTGDPGAPPPFPGTGTAGAPPGTPPPYGPPPGYGGSGPYGWGGYGYPGYPGQPPPVPYAGYAARAGGWLIDWVIVGVASYLIAIPLDRGRVASIEIHATTHGTVQTAHLSLLVPLVQIVLVLLYGALFCGSSRGQTPGMMAVGVRAVDRDTGGPIGFARALGRGAFEYLLAVLFFLPWVVDMLFPAWDLKRQTLHDKVSRTVVVRASSTWPG